MHPKVTNKFKPRKPDQRCGIGPDSFTLDHTTNIADFRLDNILSVVCIQHTTYSWPSTCYTLFSSSETTAGRNPSRQGLSQGGTAPLPCNITREVSYLERFSHIFTQPPFYQSVQTWRQPKSTEYSPPLAGTVMCLPARRSSPLPVESKCRDGTNPLEFAHVEDNCLPPVILASPTDKSWTLAR